MPSPAQVTSPSDRQVSVTRTFNAPGKYWIRFRVSAAGTGGGRNLFQDYIKVRKTD